MRRFCLYSFVLSLVLFGLIACQEKFENESEYSASNRTEFSVTEDVQTKAGTKSTPITGGTGTFKTGESTTITAKGGATISGTLKSGSGSIDKTYQEGGVAKAKIDNIHGDWTVSATIPTYTVNVAATNGGSASGGGTVEYGNSTTINCSKPSSGSWDFTGWTSSNGGTFGDKNSQSTTFTPSTDCTVTANFKSAANPTIVIWAEFTDGYADDVVTTMRSFRVMYRVIDGPTTVAKKYEVYGYYDRSTNQCYSYGPLTVAAGSNATTSTQLWNSTAGFPAGISCGRMHIAVREK